MILLFGDSWARHSTVHIRDKDNTIQNSAMFSNGQVIIPDEIPRYGYRHWELDDVFVEFQTDDWLAHYFKSHTVVNLSQQANCLININENIKDCVKGSTNLSGPLYAVVFQTDALRNFAHRVDYTHRDTVWPNFTNWCKSNKFDYTTQTLDELLERLFEQFYQNLMYIEHYATHSLNLDFKLLLVGGVNRVHPIVNKTPIKVIIPSVSEFFGLDNDTVVENHLAMMRLVQWWSSEVSGQTRNKLLTEWSYYDYEATKKAKFWANTPEFFAGRHLTSKAFSVLANHIESLVATYKI